MNNVYFKMCCDTSQLPSFQLFVPHSKPQAVRGLIKHYHIQPYPKIWHITFYRLIISKSCEEWNNILSTPLFPGLTKNKHNPARSLLWTSHIGLFYAPTNWNIINFRNKTTSIETFYGVDSFYLQDIIEIMSSLLNTCKYGAISTKYSTKMGYYIDKFISDTVILK